MDSCVDAMSQNIRCRWEADQWRRGLIADLCMDGMEQQGDKMQESEKQGVRNMGLMNKWRGREGEREREIERERDMEEKREIQIDLQTKEETRKQIDA